MSKSELERIKMRAQKALYLGACRDCSEKEQPVNAAWDRGCTRRRSLDECLFENANGRFGTAKEDILALVNEIERLKAPKPAKRHRVLAETNYLVGV
ncbi:hypothetical protein KAR91_18250 [Candidatus Pacearchaeota archaeon]|nr:hypothetical protein [Candidatus Pacearchaeota archaeon]